MIMNRATWLICFSLLPTWMALGAVAEPFEARLDATDIARGRLKTVMTFPVRPGENRFWYPKWIPGVHGPVGPVQNMNWLKFKTAGGEEIPWRRDPVEHYQFVVAVPEGVGEVTVELGYICNQPSVSSTGVDSYGNSGLGVINLNTCLLYPAGVNLLELRGRLALAAPKGWRWASSLKAASASGGETVFEEATFEQLIDSPIVVAKHLTTLRVGGPEERPVYAHFASESESALELPEKHKAELGRMVREAEKLFGGVIYDSYHFLVVASDQVPGIGLEHLRSSLNAVKERDLVEPKRWKDRTAPLLAHEYVHSWCGKYLRPTGMARANYHEPMQTELLWVYEGLTTYLGDLLSVRCGATPAEEFPELLAAMASSLAAQPGRQWRPLEDTAAVSYHLRGRSKAWHGSRRGQDYYNEGLLLWLEIDGKLRAGSDGRVSLDDFCRAFFKKQSPPPFQEYELQTVLDLLDSLGTEDWRGLVERRVQEPMERLSLEFAEVLGWRLAYGTKPSAHVEGVEEERKQIGAMESIGLLLGEDGGIVDLAPGSSADRAGLGPGMKVLGVNSRKFSKARLLEGLAASVQRRGMDLLVMDGDWLRTVTLDYSDGPRHHRLERDPSKRDWLREILAPLAAGK